MAKAKIGYVDGFVIVVPKKNIKAYQAMAKDGIRLWMKHGALDYKECVGEDLRAIPGALAFAKMTKAKSNETVVFSYIAYKSRQHRDQVNKKVMADPSMTPGNNKNFKMPFDMRKMAYGGFKVIIG